MASIEAKGEDERPKVKDTLEGVVAARGLYRLIEAARQTMQDTARTAYAAIHQLPKEASPPDGHVFSITSSTRRRVNVGKFFPGYPTHSIGPTIINPVSTQISSKSEPFLAEKIVVSGSCLIAVAENGQAREVDPDIMGDHIDFAPRPRIQQ